MSERPWLKNYPIGVPTDITLDANETIQTLIQTSCEQFKDKIAFSYFGQTLSYGKLNEYASCFAAFLQNLPRVKKGDRIAVMMPNCLQYPVVLVAAFRAGLVVVNVNPLYKPRELEYQLKDSGAKVIVLLDIAAQTLEKVMPKVPVEHVVVSSIGDMHRIPKRFLMNFVLKYVHKKVPAYHLPQAFSFRQALKQGQHKPFSFVSVRPDDIAFLQYTGGTTGEPKGAMLTHANVLSNLEQARSWLGPDHQDTFAMAITALPLYHIFCLTANFLLSIKLGGHCLLIGDPRNIKQLVAILSKTPFTYFSGVNTLFNALIQNEEFKKIDFSPLKVVLGGGASVEPKVAETWQAITKKPLTQAYGLTECCPAVSINPLNELYNGSVGFALPSTQLKLIDEAGQSCVFSETGELCIKGPQVMRGYWNKPRETAEVLSSDGWFKTGDMAYFNQKGYLFIADRKKDLILVSGFNVYPKEVEEVATSHPSVLEAAAIGVPDEKSGEAVRLFVVKKASDITEQEIIDYCRENLTGYKVPKHVQFVDELPKSNVGKILRKALKLTISASN